jgi:serine protease Do
MGIVSAKNRTLDRGTYIQNFIQTDAAINPGNSGGALINAKGELIGMNTAILSGGNSGFGGEGGNIGIGFAVPSNLAKQVMDQIEKNGKVSRGYMGVDLGQVTADEAPLLGLKSDHGAIVGKVRPGSPGEKAGLKPGDVITGIDGKPVNGSDDLTMEVISHAPGSTVALDVIRDSKPMKVTVTLGQRPSGVDWDANKGGGNDNDNNDNGNSDNANGSVTVRGITVENLTPDVAQQINAPANLKGVVVSDIDQSSPAADATLARGLVITQVNRQPVNNVSDFKRLMNQAAGKPALLTYNYQGTMGFTVVQPGK